MQATSATPLSAVCHPGVFLCHDIADCGEAAIRLKRFGICAGREIEVVQAGSPMVLRVCGARVGVSRDLSGMIMVEESAGQVVASSESAAVGAC